MHKLFSLKQDMFHQWEVIGVKGLHGSPTDLLDATAERDRLNVDMLIDQVAGFILQYGGKLHYYFKGEKMKNAARAKEMAQRFVTGCNTLKGKGKASAQYVYHLSDEFLVHSIGHLAHDKQPYCNAYGDMLTVINDFMQMYAPPLFEEQNKDYQNTPAMREFYKEAV